MEIDRNYSIYRVQPGKMISDIIRKVKQRAIKTKLNKQKKSNDNDHIKGNKIDKFV
jgi:hypothetical protein